MYFKAKILKLHKSAYRSKCCQNGIPKNGCPERVGRDHGTCVKKKLDCPVENGMSNQLNDKPIMTLCRKLTFTRP